MRKSTIQLLRFHFSFFLLPVYLFALSQSNDISWKNALFTFLILHLFVYPASNGYNSYMDRDESPIGGIKNPMQPTKQLYYVTVIMDVTAIVLSTLISKIFGLGILLYILASRAYSYRRIRLKRYPLLGFLTVFFFQGALIFLITYITINPNQNTDVPFLPCVISSLLIGALYPLTQIYQHEEDKQDDVISISYLLGKKRTFVFSMLLFLTATFLMYLRFHQVDELNHFYWYLLIMAPVVLFFVHWMIKVWSDETAANFSNSLKMNALSTVCTTIFFIILIAVKH